MGHFLPFMNGFLGFILFMLFFGYNSFASFFPIISNQAPRSYLQWVVYNPFDFFQYFGIPLTILFVYVAAKIYKQKNINALKNLTFAFLLLFIILVISGVSRAEVGRIWMPLVIFPLITLGTWKELDLKTASLMVLLLFVQIIVMTEFWVPVW